MARTTLAQAQRRIQTAFNAISDDAIGTGTDADGEPDGSDDWGHSSAKKARAVTKWLGMEWDFDTWDDAEELAVAEAEAQYGDVD